MRKRRLGGFLVASFLLLVAPQLLQAQEIPYEFESPELIVAIGDVHGDYDGFVDNLMATGLVDEDLRWTGGSAHLVQTGDVVDRGPESRKAMDLLMELERQAEAAGGRVHALLGNHEFWNAVGELSYVSEEEVKAFDGPRDEILREEHRAEAPAPGYFALREAFGPEGDYGKWIRSHNAAVKIGEVVFVHGGITKETVQLGLGKTNRRARAEMDSDTWLEGIAVSQDGVLMTRRFSTDDLRREDDERLGLELQEVLKLFEKEIRCRLPLVQSKRVIDLMLGSNLSQVVETMETWAEGHETMSDAGTGFGPSDEGRRRLNAFELSRVLYDESVRALRAGHREASLELMAEAQPLLKQTGQRGEEGLAWEHMASLMAATGKSSDAFVRYAKQALKIAREVSEARALVSLGALEARSANYANYERAMELTQAGLIHESSDR